jgi:hypothetical protein
VGVYALSIELRETWGNCRRTQPNARQTRLDGPFGFANLPSGKDLHIVTISSADDSRSSAATPAKLREPIIYIAPSMLHGVVLRWATLTAARQARQLPGSAMRADSMSIDALCGHACRRILGVLAACVDAVE